MQYSFSSQSPLLRSLYSVKLIISIVVIAVKPTKLGLDLVGGSRLVLEAQPINNTQVTPDMM